MALPYVVSGVFARGSLGISGGPAISGDLGHPFAALDIFFNQDKARRETDRQDGRHKAEIQWVILMEEEGRSTSCTVVRSVHDRI